MLVKQLLKPDCRCNHILKQFFFNGIFSVPLWLRFNVSHLTFKAPKLFEEPAVHPSAVISERCQVNATLLNACVNARAWMLVHGHSSDARLFSLRSVPSSDGLRQHHRSALPGGRQDFHQEVDHRELYHREGEGQGHQLHHHARGDHRGRVRGRLHNAHRKPIISVQNANRLRLLELHSEAAQIFLSGEGRKISQQESFTF